MKKKWKASCTKVVHWVCDNCGNDYDTKAQAEGCPCWAEEAEWNRLTNKEDIDET